MASAYVSTAAGLLVALALQLAIARAGQTLRWTPTTASSRYWFMHRPLRPRFASPEDAPVYDTKRAEHLDHEHDDIDKKPSTRGQKQFKMIRNQFETVQKHFEDCSEIVCKRL